MKVMYWSDYACPYCYIGKTHLKKAIENLNLGDQVDVKMLAFELDPTARKEYTGATVDRFARKYGLSLKGAQERIDGISEMGRAAGLDFHYAETRYTNTFDAHRLTKLAQRKDAGLADRLQERLYKAYFSEGLELADHAVLTRIALEEGMDEGEVQQLLESDQYVDDVRLDEREAQRYGVQGVPYFVVGNKYAIPGALPVESMERALKNVLDEEAKAAETAVQGHGLRAGRMPFRGLIMNVYKIPVRGYFEVNSYFLIDEDTGHGFLIDPGAQGSEIARIIQSKVWTIEKILLTHGHFDHTGGIEALQRQLSLPVYIHENGAAYLSDTRLNLSAVCGEHVIVHGAKYFGDGATFALQCHASPVLRAIHTPGHTPDSTTFYDAEDGLAFVGDTIFRGSIGNDQYPGGNRQQLLASIRERIFTLPEDTVLYSGHSEPTTVMMEKQRYGL